MGSLYYVDLLDVLRAAGVACRENTTTAGWQSRSRSSGGFSAAPLAVFWHHTASAASPESDLAYMIDGSPDAPVGNMLLDRTGTVWPIAAGASNCAGAGGPCSFSRGTIPQDGGNTRGWQIEAANNGVGEPWPAVQIDAYYRASNALNARFGNRPTDLVSHALSDGDGWTSRKIDPATAAAVQGAWRPGSANSSGTWWLADIRAEAQRRSQPLPAPQPTPEDESVPYVLKNATTGAALVVESSGLRSIGGAELNYLSANFDVVTVPNGAEWEMALAARTQSVDVK